MTGTVPFEAEVYTYLALDILIVGFRLYWRATPGGLRSLEVHDYLMAGALVVLIVETVLACTALDLYNGLTNNDMTDQQRARLDPSSDEYASRVSGSKAQVAQWFLYPMAVWLIKASMCAFYSRLTTGLDSYRNRILVGYALMGTTYAACVLCVFFSCHPFPKNWQINPNPEGHCLPAINTINVHVILYLNLLTNLYLVAIPIPMLWKARLSPAKKIGLIVIFTGGIFVMIAGFFRCIVINAHPNTGALEATTWGLRESFVAVFTANLPLIWGWMRQVSKPVLGSLVSTTKRQYKSRSGSYKLSDGNDSRSTKSHQTSSTTQSKNHHNLRILTHDRGGSTERIMTPSMYYNGMIRETTMEKPPNTVPENEEVTSHKADNRA